MKFALRNLPAESSNASRQSFDTLEDARVALRDILGWPEVQLGPGYTTPDAMGQVWRAYHTPAEAQADPDGEALPRIERINTDARASND